MKFTKKQIALIDATRIELQNQFDCGDIEAAHERADSLLCDLLIGIGLNDVVADYRIIEKWYA